MIVSGERVMVRWALVASMLLFSGALTAKAENAPSGYARQEPLALRGANPNQTTLPRYGKFELTLDLTATYDNPFDPDDVDVFAQFVAPNGTIIRVNGFLSQPFTRELDGASERIEPAGDPVWRIRFCPDTEGRWRYTVSVKDRTGVASLPEATLTVTPSNDPGMIRRSGASPGVFVYDAGDPFFAVGENLCWSGKRGTFDYEDWLAALGGAGGNWIRVWMSTWNCGIEWTHEDKGDWRTGTYPGLGAYSLGNAWKLDTILDLAERNGIRVMLCFGTFGELSVGGYFNEGQWNANPYNAANGGPCAEAKDFWINEQARRLYQRRLRYIAARYGGRTTLHAWEFWNEVQAPAAWVGEMARFLKGAGEFEGRPADPYRHLVSTTYGNPEIWRIPELDFTMTHHYGEGNIADSAPIIHDDARQHAGFGKPHLMAEFGIDWRNWDGMYDSEKRGVNLHNGLWSAALSGDAGSAMIWYWDGYVHPGNLYGQFTALRRFTDGVPWTAGEWKPMEVDTPLVTMDATGEGVPETWRDMVLTPSGGWGRSAVPEFTITPDKGASGATLPSFLYSPGKADLRTTPAFHVNYEQPGRFEVKVDEVSASARLRILVDGVVGREVALSANPPDDPGAQPEYEKTEFKTQYGIYVARFGKAYGVDVPAGTHTIVLDVTEGDWLSVENYTLAGYSSTRFTNVHLYALTNGTVGILWIQNPEHNWKNVLEKRPIPAIPAAATIARGLSPGAYTVEWWDTWKGEVTRREDVSCADGALPLELPEIATDLAARIFPGRVR